MPASATKADNGTQALMQRRKGERPRAAMTAQLSKSTPPKPMANTATAQARLLPKGIGAHTSNARKATNKARSANSNEGRSKNLIVKWTQGLVQAKKMRIRHAH